MRRLKSLLVNCLLVVVSITIMFGGLEGFLRLWARIHAVQVHVAQPVAAVPAPSDDVDADIPVPPELVAVAKSRQQVLTMPESWEAKPTEVAGAVYARRWHDVVEVYNIDRMRWAKPIPAKRDGVYRVMVVGDSLTFGAGIEEKWRFSNLLEEWMTAPYAIEFVNLGRNGDQSEDVLRVINQNVERLKPNLVLYAVCLNDFLPAGVGQYNRQLAYSLPIPESMKTFFIQNTKAGAFLDNTYDGALRRLRLRGDFIDDILTDFEGYQVRFAADVSEMNKAVLAAGLPPIVGMVVDQYPLYGSRGYQIAKIAEAALVKAGAVVIPTEDYYRRYSGQYMGVSRWEGHPNEVANFIWANMIAKVLRKRDDLRAYRRPTNRAAFPVSPRP